MIKSLFTTLSLLAATVFAQQVTFNNSSGTRLRIDNGTFGPEIEEFHYYYDQWPIGLAVSSTGRLFVCYTRGDYEYTLGVAVNQTAEKAYPSQALNLLPDELNTTIAGTSFGPSNSSAFVSVQALYITPKTSSRPETLWVLDTGRPTIHSAAGDPSMPYAQPGGPKLVAISLTNDTIYQTFTFPSTVHYPDSYMNDVRFDLRANVTTGGKGVAYIVDSSNEGRTGFIMLDLATGDSWRRLNGDHSVARVPNDVPSYFGHPFYFRELGMPIQWQQEGLDGIQLSPDGQTVYYSPLTSNTLYSIPSANLRERDSNPLAEIWAHNNVSSKGQRGGNGNGFEGDNNGLIYQLMPTQNAIYYYDPTVGQTRTFVRDPRILWPDSATIASDGYFYMNINQLPFQPDWNFGVDGRLHPGAVLRAKLPNNGTKITSLY